MKYLSTTCLLFILLFPHSALIADQTFTTLPDTTDWMPLKVGNIYQQKVDWFQYGFGGINNSGTNFENLSVIGDTIIGDKTFYKLLSSGSNNPFPENLFYHYDSLYHKILVRVPGIDTAKLAVDFNLPIDSVFISYIKGEPIEFISLGISSEVLWGDSINVYSIKSTNIALDKYTYKFVKEIGLIKYQYTYADNMYVYNENNFTISALIDSNIFNPIVLKIDSLYPVIDRPIDTFPYLTTIPYTANYKQLISHFFLSLIQQREDSTIFSRNYNISISNPRVQINLTDIEIGDVIKLKATLKDISIFNNVSTFPDAGWLSYLILPPVVNSESITSNLTYSLRQNYPNPFNPFTTIKYSVPERTFVSLKIYDVLGNEIKILVDEEKDAGNYSVKFNASKLASGIYFYKMMTGKFVQTKKMILIR